MRLEPGKLCGAVTPPPSKSGMHRALICAALAPGKSRVSPMVVSDDITATIQAMQAFGANISSSKHEFLIKGPVKVPKGPITVDALESGSTLRFLIPVAAALGAEVTFQGHGRLPNRPQGPILELFDRLGVAYTYDGALPLTISSPLNGGKMEIRGDVSSQFITGLLLALPLLPEKSEILLSSKLQSRPYIDITISVMERFGVVVRNEQYRRFSIAKGQYHFCNYEAEADWSQAAFWLVAAALGNPVQCMGMNESSVQGDRAVLDIIHRWEQGDVLVDAGDIPDLVPILAVLGSLGKGTMRIENAARLRMKESDRLAAITSELKKLGANIEEGEDFLVIHGKDSLNGGQVSSHGDHRIAMSMAIAATRCRTAVTISGSEAVQKSYPNFFEEYQRLWQPK